MSDTQSWATNSPLIVKNKLAVTCIIFAGITLLSSVLNLTFAGAGAVTDDIHILARFLIVVIAIGSLYIFDWFQSWPLRIVHLVHYFVTMALVLMLVWLAGFVIELHPDAYRDIFLNYTGIYLILAVIEFVYLRARNRRKILDRTGY